jgi:hypothetical protein
MNGMKGLCLLVVTACLQGCLDQRINLIETGALRLDVQSSDHVHVHWVRAYQEPSGVTISGLLEHQDNDSGAIKVHVDVTLLSSTHEVLAQAVSLPVFLPSERKAHATRAKPFTVTLQGDLPENALVRVKVHFANHESVSGH